MATIYTGINTGENEYTAAQNTSSTSKEIEIVFTDTNVPSVEQLLLALDNLKNFILRNGKSW